MSARAARAQIACETLEILDRGFYRTPTGRDVSIRDALQAARSGSILYTPTHFENLRAHVVREQPAVSFEVTNETTLSAARRLTDAGERVLALNFASARNPAGGFLKGSQAQEESLARASGLYACINPVQGMYQANRDHPSCLYTDRMIYSPNVPVFRDDADALLAQPYNVSFLTAPAVNAGAVRANEPHSIARIAPVMRGRVEKVLSLAVVHGHRAVVLGAWGCGVFANDPDAVAGWFAEQLTGEGPFRTAFQTVVFAVLDRTPARSTIGPFERRFASPR